MVDALSFIFSRSMTFRCQILNPNQDEICEDTTSLAIYSLGKPPKRHFLGQSSKVVNHNTHPPHKFRTLTLNFPPKIATSLT